MAMIVFVLTSLTGQSLVVKALMTWLLHLMKFMSKW